MSIVAPRCIVKPKQKAVAIDIDEVLCPFFKGIMKWKNFQDPGGKYPYVYSKVLNISEKDSRKMVYDFYESEEFTNLVPISGSQAGIAYLKGKGYKIYAVTGRQSAARQRTETWLQTHYPYAFDDLVITNSYTPAEIPKSDICRSLAIGTIIDDNLKICLDCEANHIRSMNFIGDPVYPWCEDNEFAVRRWDDIICSTII